LIKIKSKRKTGKEFTGKGELLKKEAPKGTKEKTQAYQGGRDIEGPKKRPESLGGKKRGRLNPAKPEEREDSKKEEEENKEGASLGRQVRETHVPKMRAKKLQKDWVAKATATTGARRTSKNSDGTL